MFQFRDETTKTYEAKGYAQLKGLVAGCVGRRMLATVKDDLLRSRIDLSGRHHPDILDRPTVDVYGPQFAPFRFLLWGLTPLMCGVTRRRLAPSYSFFRIYRRGDVLRFHTDRPACDHSMSLTLDYSDGHAWPFEVMKMGTTYQDMLQAVQDVEPFLMEAGDGIIYRGVDVPHGRMNPNPNEWSAHIFLHWVDLDGPHRDHAFDGEAEPPKVVFDIV